MAARNWLKEKVPGAMKRSNNLNWWHYFRSQSLVGTTGKHCAYNKVNIPNLQIHGESEINRT